MRRIFSQILFFTMILLASKSFCQYGIYYPDGRKVKMKIKTVKQLLDTIGISETTLHIHELGQVYFLRLTNKPIFVLFDEVDYPAKINDIIRSYDYTSYLNSYSYYWDLKDMISEGTLTKEYLITVFGEPESKNVDDSEDEYWAYEKYNAIVIFSGETPIKADVVNYRAIKRNNLQLSNFTVTGGDYSIGFSTSVTNYSEKTIKYLHFTVTANNPVGDKVKTLTVKGVGPIEQNESVSFEFDDIIYSRVASHLSIDNIKIEYMDGKFKNIPKKEVNQIKYVDWETFGNTVRY